MFLRSGRSVLLWTIKISLCMLVGVVQLHARMSGAAGNGETSNCVPGSQPRRKISRFIMTFLPATWVKNLGKD